MNFRKVIFTLAIALSCMTVFAQRIDIINVSAKPDGKYLEDGGDIVIEGEVLNGNKTGTWIQMHPRTELPHFIIQYKDGKKDGLFLEFDKQASLLKKMEYKDGELNGSCYEWFKGGRLSRSCVYQNGLLHGPLVKCYDKGPIQEEANYKNGVRDGLTVWYNHAEKAQGAKYAADNYKDGLFEGSQET